MDALRSYASSSDEEHEKEEKKEEEVVESEEHEVPLHLQEPSTSSQAKSVLDLQVVAAPDVYMNVSLTFV